MPKKLHAFDFEAVEATPIARVSFAQVVRLDAAKTVEELKAALSGTEPIDVQAPEVQAAIGRVTEG